jgi:Secretion system C-terminal sorting domain
VLQKIRLIKKIKRLSKWAFLIIIAHCSLFIVNCFSQSITWQRSYNSQFNQSDYGEDVCEADGDNFYIVGASQTVNTAHVMYILKINKFGDTLWSRNIDGAWAKAVTRSNDGGCVVTGITDALPFALKLTPDGNIVWNRTYGTSNIGFYGNDIISTPDGGYIGCAAVYYNIGYIFKIDSLGNFQWDRFYQGGYSKSFSRIINASDSGYVLVGTERFTQTDTARGIICKIGTKGNIVWENNYRVNNASTSFYNLENVNNSFLVSGGYFDGDFFRVFLKRLDLEGVEYYSKVFESINDEFKIRCKVINSNRYVLSVGKWAFTPTRTYAKLLIIDSLCNIQMQKNYDAPGDLEVNSILKTDNEDILFTGFAEYSFYADVYVLRTDSLLNAPPPIGIGYTSNSLPMTHSLTNYPNPFNASTKFIYSINKPQLVKLIIYDLTGRVIDILSDNKNQVGTFELLWNSNGLATGVYFVSLYAGNIRVLTKKIVLLK